MVFTTEEIYGLIKKDNESIHEKNFVSIPLSWKNKEINNKWKKLFQLKQSANIAIEEKRASKEIGSSLEAEIEIKVNEETYNLLDGLDLAEYFITSKATKFKIKNEKIESEILVKKAKGNKCPRCWKILEKSCERCDVITKQI